MIAETRRLRIRRLTDADADFVFHLVNQPSFLVNIGDKGVRTIDDAHRFILDGPWTARQPPGFGQFAVELKTTGELVGVCGVLYRERLDLTDVGCAFLPQHWRRGYASEAAAAVMSYAQNELGVERIVELAGASGGATLINDPEI